VSITVTFESVLRAKTDACEQEKIFWSVFYDAKAQPKLRKWLVKKGVPLQHVEDLESEMKLAMFKAIQRYNHGKIPFEKYIWTEFNQILINWFVSRSRKSGRSVSIDEMIEVHGDSIELNFGSVSVEAGEMDVETVFNGMTQRQAFIARCLYYSDWTSNDIREYLGVNTSQYYKEISEIKRIVSEYVAR